MKLVIATPLYPPEIGGPATYAKLLEEGLPKKGIEVEIVKFSEVRHLPKLIRHFVYYRRVLHAARGADVVLALDPVSVGLPAMKAAQKAGKPFVVKVVGDYAWEQGTQRFGITQPLDEFVKTKQKNPFVRALQKIQTRVANAATRVIVPSEYLRVIVVAWEVPREKIEVIYNSVPLETLGSVREDVAKLPRPIIVSSGRLVIWKHMNGLISAVAHLRENGVQASLVIVGDGPLRGKLITQGRKMLPGNFILTRALSHADTLAVIEHADIFVLNSSYEGLSHALIETLMLGKPIIATRVGGNPEIIKDGEDGLLVSVADTQALTAAIGRILSDPGLRARLSAGALESSRRFSTDAMLSATTKLMYDLRGPTYPI